MSRCTECLSKGECEEWCGMSKEELWDMLQDCRDSKNKICKSAEKLLRRIINNNMNIDLAPVRTDSANL